MNLLRSNYFFAIYFVFSCLLLNCKETKTAVASTTPESAQTVAAAPTAQDIPLNPNVKKGTLENGLTYYIKNNEKPEDKVELRLVVNVGSILEDEDQE